MSSAALSYPARLQLTGEQEAAIGGILSSLRNGAPEITFGGYAGTGKTTVIRALMDRFQQRRIGVGAFTGKAANVLRQKGIQQAATLHSMAYLPFEDAEGRIKFRLRNSLDFDLVVVDEASMVSRCLYDDLKSFGVPILFCGDHGQLPPVADTFNLMESPQYRLETIHRNAGPIAEFADHIRRGGDPTAWRGDPSVVRFRTRSSVTMTEMCAADQVICARNKTRCHLNKIIRRRIGFEGTVPPQVGERIICLQNRKYLEVYNGQQGTCSRTGEKVWEKERLPVLDFEVDGRVIANVPYFPEQFGREHTIEVKWKDEGVTPVPFDLAYAITCHKSQGDQWDSVMVIDQPCHNINRARWRYTAATRAKSSLVWVTGVDE